MLGPKKFRGLIESISTVTLEYAVIRIRSGQVEKGVLSLTYFQRISRRYLSPLIRVLIALAFCLSHFHKDTVRAMKPYLVEIRHLLN